MSTRIMARKWEDGLLSAGHELVDLQLVGRVLLGAINTALDEVKPVHVKSVRDKVIVAGARRGTVGKVLGAMRRLFAAAVEDEILEHNPTNDVRLPKQRGAEREIVKPRVILTDEEIGQFLASEEARYITGMNIRVDAGAMLKGMPAGMG